MKVLFITKFLPLPLDNGGKIAAFSMLKALSRSCELDYISFYENENMLLNKDKLRRLCSDVRLFYREISLEKSRTKNYLYFIKSLFSSKPYFIEKFKSGELAGYIKNNVRAENYDLIFIDGLNMCQYIPQNGMKKSILQEHNIEFELLHRFVKHENNPLRKALIYMDYKKLKKYELGIIRNLKNIIYFTDLNRSIIEAEGCAGHRPYVIPVSIDTEYFKPISEKEINLVPKLYSNGSLLAPPNFEGILWFDREVMPLIQNCHPGMKLHHIGQYSDNTRKKLSENIMLEGYMKDIRERMNSDIIHIVPLRVGGGIRVKILNSLASGIPIVATRMAAEGLMVLDGHDISIADGPRQFAQKIIELLENDGLRRKYIKNSRMTAEKYYAYEVVEKMVEEMLQDLLGSVARKG